MVGRYQPGPLSPVLFREPAVVRLDPPPRPGVDTTENITTFPFGPENNVVAC
jgi:hypothetical protein